MHRARGSPMDRGSIPLADRPARWTRATLMILRLALLVFLIWVLVSAKGLVEGPLAVGDQVPGPNSPSATQAPSGCRLGVD